MCAQLGQRVGGQACECGKRHTIKRSVQGAFVRVVYCNISAASRPTQRIGLSSCADVHLEPRSDVPDHGRPKKACVAPLPSRSSTVYTVSSAPSISTTHLTRKSNARRSSPALIPLSGLGCGVCIPCSLVVRRALFQRVVERLLLLRIQLSLQLRAGGGVATSLGFVQATLSSCGQWSFLAMAVPLESRVQSQTVVVMGLG